MYKINTKLSNWTHKVKFILHSLPYPICGISLGFAILGNLLQHHSELAHRLCGVISFLIIILITLKIFLYPKDFFKDMKSPIIASSFGTFPMTCMLLSVYVKPFLGKFAFILWILAIIIHILLITYFSLYFIYSLKLENVYASYYIVYVGIAMIAVTAPAYQMEHIGIIVLKLAFGGCIAVSTLLVLRHIYYPQIPESAKSLSCMIVAPVSLLLTGYMKSYSLKSIHIVTFLLALAGILYLVCLLKAIRNIILPFYPSVAAFTFPFAVSATACQLTTNYLNNLDYDFMFLSLTSKFTTLIAIILTIYACILFIREIFIKSKTYF